MADDSTTPGIGATIDDVASRAGVSVATVSRALRGLPNVADSTRTRIQQAADELRYRPDPAAARLARGRTNSIAIGIPALNGWYFSNVVAGAEAVSTAAGYEVQVIALGSPSDLERLVDPTMRLERRADALVLVDIQLDVDVAIDLRRRGVAVGTIGFHVPGCPAVQLDDVRVGQLAADHLVEIGSRRPGLLAGLADDPTRERVPSLRRTGFERGLATLGLSIDDRLARVEFGIEGGRVGMAALLDRPAEDRPDGVFAMSDELAFGALMELRSRGLEVGSGPGTIAIMGVDDHEFAQVVELTTVRQHVGEHGAMLARRLVDEIRVGRQPGMSERTLAPTDQPELVRPPIQLVTRASTGTRHTDRHTDGT
ncbi:MAG: LacI family DNA-binding transcriptional regulator [Actinomycetota bacterium]